MEKEYKRISCDFYDQLEIYGTFKKVLNITFKDEGGKEETITTKVKTLETINQEEFLITDTLRKIRLDKIVSIEKVADEL